MNKIEPTLDRPLDRAEREPHEHLVKLVPGVERTEQRPRAEIPAPGHMVYTQTRVVNVSAATLEANRVINGADNSPAVTAYKLLRTQVLRSMHRNGWNVLGVTSPGAGEGKTLTAVNLAVSLALDVNHTVLLADLDLRRPGVHRYFGLDAGRGLSDFLAEDFDLREILFNPGLQRLIVLPGGAPLVNSAEMLSSPRMVWLAQELRSRYPARIVLFDLPPLLAADDVLAFAPYLDAVLLVVEEGRTGRDDLAQARELLRDIPVLGPVINKSRARIRVY
jgi:capsular exopolysaccharide synthesis family protein